MIVNIYGHNNLSDSDKKENNEHDDDVNNEHDYVPVIVNVSHRDLGNIFIFIITWEENMCCSLVILLLAIIVC